jgi:hypothetical protein
VPKHGKEHVRGVAPRLGMYSRNDGRRCRHQVPVDASLPIAGPPLQQPLAQTRAGQSRSVVGAATVRVGPGTDVATLTKVLQ